GDNFVAVKWLGVQALGLYERAYQLMAMPATLLGQVLDDVLFPAMAQIQFDTGRLAVAYRRLVAGMAVMTLPLSAVAVALAPELIYAVLGPKWGDAALPFQVLAVGTLCRASYKVSDSLTRAVGAVYQRAWRQWIYAALALAPEWCLGADGRWLAERVARFALERLRRMHSAPREEPST